MKKNFTRIYILAGLALSTSACSDFLEPKIDNTYGDDVTWRLPDRAEGVLINAYANVPQFVNYFDANNFLDAATDNAVTNTFGSSIYRLGAGALSPTDNPVGTWGTAYNQFRNIHLFLENGLTDKIRYRLQDDAANQAYKNRLKGEAYYLRAWWGFKLLQQYGGKTADGEALGYPIITKTLSDAEAQNTNITRNTYEECVAQILSDCDTALKYLPLRYTGGDLLTGISGLGRADRQTSATLKSIVTLYAASPAFQPDNIVRINGMGRYTVVNGVDYQAKWKRATTQAQAAISVIGSFDSRVSPLRFGYFTPATTPTEFIWRRFANNRSLETQNYPPFSYGNGQTSPSQNLVNAFPAKNGYPITDPRSNYDPANPYTNRDPRLELTVMYNGDTLAGRPLEIYQGGKDSREVFANATRTGYYLRKWLAPTSESLLEPNNLLNAIHYHVMLRKTEVYLNFAEASNEAYGPTGVSSDPGAISAVAMIKRIRAAAGISQPDSYVDEIASQGKDAFRTLIQNERRLELAFENHRYFDMRRWVLPLTEPVKGVTITQTGTNQYTYQETEVEKRGFNSVKYYYHPFPYDELVKSPTIKNNLGW